MKNAAPIGTSSIEVLVALAISGIVLSGLILNVKESLSFYHFSTKELLKQNAKAKISQLFYEISREYQLHRLPLSPRIHSFGKVKFYNGKLNPVSTRADTLSPDPNSDAITSTELVFRSGLKVLRTENFGTFTRFLACPAFPENIRKQEPWSYTDTKSFLAVSTDGVNELVGTTKPAVKSGCYALELQATSETMTEVAQGGLFLPFARALIPIRRNYTLYLDRGGNLRFLSHLGKRNTENQPLLTGIQNIHISESKILGSELPKWKVTFSLFSGKPEVVYTHAQLTKSSMNQFLASMGSL